MRRNVGLFMLAVGTALKVVFMILLVGSAAVGIWWPLALVIIDNPPSLLWGVPLGVLLTGLSFAVAQLLYDLIIGMPLAMLTTWLLKAAG